MWSSGRCTAASAAAPSARVSGPRAAERVPAHARAVSGRRFSGAGQVRLRQRRHGSRTVRAISATATCSSLYPASDALRRSRRGRARPAGGGSAGARRAGRQPRDRHQRVVGRRAALGDRISVVGAGTVGCLVAWLAGRMPGCDVELVDINPARATIAETLGVRFATPEHASSNADLVIHASGSPAGLELALRVAGFEATVVEMSWYGDQASALRTRRRVSRAAADAQVVAGRQRRRRPAARAMGHAPADAARAVDAAARRARRADHRRERLRSAAGVMADLAADASTRCAIA